MNSGRMVCDWLRAEGINPRDVPAEPGAIHYEDGRAGVLIVERGQDGGIVTENDEWKAVRKWFEVSSPPPSDGFTPHNLNLAELRRAGFKEFVLYTEAARSELPEPGLT